MHSSFFLNPVQNILKNSAHSRETCLKLENENSLVIFRVPLPMNIFHVKILRKTLCYLKTLLFKDDFSIFVSFENFSQDPKIRDQRPKKGTGGKILL